MDDAAASTPTDGAEAHTKRRSRAPLLALVVLIALITAVVVDQLSRPCEGCTLQNATTIIAIGGSCEPSAKACLGVAFDELTAWIARDSIAGTFVMMAALCACAVILIPASALTIGTGAAFAQALGVGVGTVVGSTCVWFGLSAGAELAFLVARYLLHDLVQRQVHRWRVTSAIDAALREEGLKVMLLLRLSPLIPYNAFNYIIATTSVSLRDYTLALPAMIPATFGYVYIGASIAEAASAASGFPTAQGVQVTLLVVGAVATVVATGLISLVAKRHLKKKLMVRYGQRTCRRHGGPMTFGQRVESRSCLVRSFIEIVRFKH